MPLVSILVPCYNHEQFVEDCIRSIIAQDYANIEILINDDNSQDKSWEIIQRLYPLLIERFVRVVITKSDQNMGVTKSINYLLNRAKGDYIKLIASDDMLQVNCISFLVDNFKAHPNNDVLVCNGYIIAENDRFPAYSNIFFYDDGLRFPTDDFFRLLYCNNFIFAPGVIMKKKVYEENGTYDETIDIEDWEYWLRLAKNGVLFSYIDSCLVCYRKNIGSITSTVKNEHLEQKRKKLHSAEIDILKKYCKYVKKDVYVDQIIRRILDEIHFAKKNRLRRWEKELKQEAKEFIQQNKLDLKRKFSVWFYLHCDFRDN